MRYNKWHKSNKQSFTASEIYNALDSFSCEEQTEAA